MAGWVETDPEASFFHLFAESIKRPEEISRSKSVKAISTAEQDVTGPSLHRLTHLDVNRLVLANSTHDRKWAVKLLRRYGPVHPAYNWQEDAIEGLGPHTIEEESNVFSFLSHAYLQRALCAAVFLYQQSIGGPSERCPNRQSKTEFRETSSAGKGGKPDWSFFRHAEQFAQAEAKTTTVCTVGRQEKKDVLWHLSAYAAEAHLRLGLTAEYTWEKKGRGIILQVGLFLWDMMHLLTWNQLQVWHQLLTRGCGHTIIANPNHFLLALRGDNELQLSDIHDFHHDCLDPTDRREALISLSFFLAHALFSRFPSEDCYCYIPIPPLITTEGSSDSTIAEASHQHNWSESLETATGADSLHGSGSGSGTLSGGRKQTWYRVSTSSCTGRM